MSSAITPFTIPVKTPRRIIKGLMSNTAPILCTKRMYASSNWVMLWNKAPIRLKPIVLNKLGAKNMTTPITSVLVTPPPKLSIKLGPRNVPVNIDERITLIKVTIMATRTP